MKRQKIETRRMLLFLPMLVVPLLAGVFYALGGGSAQGKPAAVAAGGINTSLPDAKFSGDSLEDKMAVYNHSGKMEADSSSGELQVLAGRMGFEPVEDPQAKAIEQRLSLLNKELAKPEEPVVTAGSGRSRVVVPGMEKDVDKLEMLMKSMSSGSGEDPEMKQLSAMLQSIQEIQNPELARLKYAASEVKAAGVESRFNAIPAVVDGDQKVVQGAVVRLKLLDSMVINGQLIAKGHLVFGLAVFSNQRLNLEIKNIRLGHAIVPVNLTVFDLRDAMSGINAPEAMLSDAVSGGIVDASGNVGISGFDLPTQLAGAGIDAARSLLARKVRRIKQPLKSGYPVLLRDNTRK